VKYAERVLPRALIACALVAGCGRFGFDLANDASVDSVDSAPPLPASLTVEVGSFTTASATFVDIPGSAFRLPAATGVRWLLLTSASLESTIPTGLNVEARYLVDDVEAGIGATQTSAPARPGPWQHVDVIDGELEHRIVYQLRDAQSATSTISQLHVIAIPLRSQDIRFSFVDPPQVVTSATPVPHTTLSLGMLSGDYVLFLSVNATDLPAQSDAYVSWLGPSGETWMPEMQQPREPLQSYFVVQRATIESPDARVTLLAWRGGGDATVAYARAVAVRSDAFASVDFAHDEMFKLTAALPQIDGAQIDGTPGPASRYVLVTSVGLEEPCSGDPDAERAVHVRIDATTQTTSHATDNCAYAATYGIVRALAALPGHVATGYSSQNGSLVSYLGSQVLLLGLR
jgi:hypothetical protein